MLALEYDTRRTALTPLGVRRALASVLVLVSFVLAVLRPSPLSVPYVESFACDVAAGEQQSRSEEVVGKQAELCRVPSARPVLGSEPSGTPRLRGAALHSLKGSGALAVSLLAPSVALGVRPESRLSWTPDAPTPSELMVFLN